MARSAARIYAVLVSTSNAAAVPQMNGAISSASAASHKNIASASELSQQTAVA
jgi:hypothetical protein